MPAQDDEQQLRVALAAAAEPARAEAERAYIRHVEAWCEELIQREPTALPAAVAAVPLDLLRESRHRQLIGYYRGLAEGLQDRPRLALAAFDQLLAEPALEPRIRGRTLNSAALFVQSLGDYQRASDYYTQSLAIWRDQGDPMREGLTLLNMGILQYELQQYAQAEARFLTSAALFQALDLGYRQAQSYNELGLLYRDQGRWNESLDFFGRTLALLEQQEATDALGRVTNNIGEVELLRGQFELARACFERALALMTTRFHVVDTQLNLGLLAQAQGDDQGALAHYEAALQVARSIDRHEALPQIHYRLGHATQRLGLHDQAAAHYDAAIAQIEATREPLRDEGLMISLMGRWQLVYEAAIDLCLQRGDTAGAFDYAEQARARAFADMLSKRGGLSDVAVTPISALDAQRTLQPGTLLLCYFATGLRGPETALLAAIPREAVGLRACLANEPRLICFALRCEALRAVVCPLDPNVLQASQAVRMNDGRRFLRPAILRRIYDALIAPIAESVLAATRVVIAPHGPLHQLPFAALLDPDSRPLLDRVPRLSYTPSATVLLRGLQAARSPAECSCLALGYNGGADHDLRHIEAEAVAVAQLCGGDAWPPSVDVCERLAQEGARYRWLHLACHGEFDLEEPLNSWLAIGPGARLSAADVMQRMRLNADLVTLSACRSGLSRVLRGDEPMGLVRAFMSAGARAVLVTLWQVEDLSARLLMEQFYTALLANSDPAAALYTAQQQLRALSAAAIRSHAADLGEESALSQLEAETPFDDPLFWAAFVLVGGSGFSSSGAT